MRPPISLSILAAEPHRILNKASNIANLIEGVGNVRIQGDIIKLLQYADDILNFSEYKVDKLKNF